MNTRDKRPSADDTIQRIKKLGDKRDVTGAYPAAEIQLEPHAARKGDAENATGDGTTQGTDTRNLHKTDGFMFCL